MKFTERELLLVTAGVIGGVALKGTYNVIRDHFKKKSKEDEDQYEDEEETVDNLLAI